MPLSKSYSMFKYCKATIPNFSLEQLSIYNHVPFGNWECQTHIDLTTTFTTCCPGNMSLHIFLYNRM